MKIRKCKYNFGNNNDGVFSTINGYATETNNFGETAVGILNKSTLDPDTFTSPDVVTSSKATLFSVGNGSDNVRKNAFEIKANGDTYINGVGGYDGTNSEDATSVSESIQSVQDSSNKFAEDIESIHIEKSATGDTYVLKVAGEDRGTITNESGVSFTPGNGLQLVDTNLSVKIDPTSESYLTAEQDGLKISGIDAKFGDYLPLAGGTISGSITFESELDTNGHEYVDLGLPSGNLWAKCNIGANTEEEEGLYFQWGDTQGYTAEQVGREEGQKAFSWADYKFVTDDFSINFSKYNDSDDKIVLDLEDDAAHAIMGGNWRMPTFEEYKELFLNTDIYLVPTEGAEIQGTVQEQSGGDIIIDWASQAEGTSKGVKFYKKGDKQTYMFVPISGFACADSVQDVSEYGYLLSSSRLSSTADNAYNFSFSVNVGRIDNTFRYWGIPVRGVYPKSYTGNIITVSGKTSTDLLNAGGGTVSIDDLKTQLGVPDTSNLATKDELSGYLPLTGGTIKSSAEGSSKITISADSTNQDFIAITDTSGIGMAAYGPSGVTIYNKKQTDLLNATSGTVSIDDIISQVDLSGYLPLTGGELTGKLTLDGNLYANGSSMFRDLVQVFYGDDSELRVLGNTGSFGTPGVSLLGSGKIQVGYIDGDNLSINKDGITIPNKTTSDLLNAGGSTTPVSDIATQVQASIVDSAPETLDTLNELAAALGDDPNFATTVTNQIAQKADKTTATTSTDGLMSATDKQKLDGLSNYTLPTASATQLGGVRVGDGLEITEEGVLNCTIDPGSGTVSWGNIQGKPTFSTVATSGLYSDLTGTPDLSNYVTSTQLTSVAGSNTYTGANYISKETNLTDAVVQLDEEIKATNDNLALEHANAEAAYVKKAGDTMTGTLHGNSLSFSGSMILGAGNVVLSSSNSSGFIISGDNPSNLVTIIPSGGSSDIITISTGGISLSGKDGSDILTAAGSTTKLKTINSQSLLGEGNIEIQVEGGGITDAPSDGKLYGRKNAQWTEVTLPEVEVPTKVSELTNDSGFQTEAQVSAKISALVDSAPETLDTLNELAAALGDDPNFATTITTQLGNKLDTSTYNSDKATFALKSELPDMSNYALKSEVPNVESITTTDIDELFS